MKIAVINNIPYYLGKEGSQCKCGSFNITELAEDYVCKDCTTVGKDVDFVCHTLPDGLILDRV